ncbi:MAG: tyrosine-type recombinase/integrase [Acidobacteriota bacterium]
MPTKATKPKALLPSPAAHKTRGKRVREGRIAVVSPLPSLIAASGPKAEGAFWEFFTAQIRNKNTRAAYFQAVRSFMAWSERRGLTLQNLTPVHIAAYIESHDGAPPTVKQHLAALRMLFDHLVIRQVLPWNPASSVRGPRYSVKRGKTPVLSAEQARSLLDAIDITKIGGLRDRALIGVMIFSFARVSAVIQMNVSDYYPAGKKWWIRLSEKGGKIHELPVHHKAEEYLDAYVAAAGIGRKKDTPLFRSMNRERNLTQARLTRTDVLRLVKRWARAAKLPENTCCHTLRATGITAYLEKGGTVEHAQRIANHEDPRTTKQYDRRGDEVTLDEIERIAI